MRRVILGTFLTVILATSAVAEERPVFTYLTGRDVVHLSYTQRLHYVVGLLDAWFLEADQTNEVRFGWLIVCAKKGVGSDARHLEAMFRRYLKDNPFELEQPGSKLFHSAILNLCAPYIDRKVMLH